MSLTIPNFIPSGTYVSQVIASIQEHLCGVNSEFARVFDIVLFVSFQAHETLGRRILEGAKKVNIFGEGHTVRAEVEHINGYSAHADQSELLAWAAHFAKQRLQKTFLVHGEEEAALTLAEKLRQQRDQEVKVRMRGEKFTF